MSSRSASPAPARSSPSTPRSAHSRRATQPTRMKQHHHHAQQPGLLSPSHSPKLESPPVVPRPQPSLERDPAQADEGKRRRKAKQNCAESPPKPAASVSSSDELAAPVPEAQLAAAGTPSKASRRRRGKANRQPSPPLPDGEAAHVPALEPPAPIFPSSTPPQTDLGALAHHSRSVPPDPFLQAPRFDTWDMPTVSGTGDAPKQNLSWQQELLSKAGSGPAQGSGRGRGDSPVARPRSRGGVVGKDARTSGSASSSSTMGKARPRLHTSHSESGTTGAGPSLNWQQELLLQMDPVAMAQQQQQQLQPAGASNGLTPARQRRNQIKDSITFGLGGLDLSEDDNDVFASPGARRSAQQSRGRTQPSSAAVTGFSTPTKPQQLVAEPRYAGPTFHNSPAPSSLPMPSFMMRRKVDGVAV